MSTRNIANRVLIAAVLVGGVLVAVSFNGLAPRDVAVGMMAYGFSAVILGCVGLLGLVATE